MAVGLRGLGGVIGVEERFLKLCQFYPICCGLFDYQVSPNKLLDNSTRKDDRD